jgi:alpha-mannosidase
MFFTAEKIENQLKEIRETIHRGIQPIPKFKFLQSECLGAEAKDFDDSGWADFSIGDTWGGFDVVAWFRAQVPVPVEWRGRKLALRVLVGPRDGGSSTAETLLYVNGEALQGIDVWHEEAWLPPEALVGDDLHIALKAWSGVLDPPDRRRFKLAELVWIDEGAGGFYYLADTMLRSIKLLDENDLRRARLLELLNDAFHCVDFLKPRSEAFYCSLEEAGRCLEAGLSGLQMNEIKPRVVGIGHSHIDMAWLWRLSHTREKAARTFSTVLNLMRQYPEYRFMHSSPQLYAYLKQDYPEIYARVKEKIASGEWELTGGMWIEADTNLTGGESLVRQILFGKRFAREEFGLDMQVLWLPDVFGYTWALPQIVRKSGLNYFMTTKISWSQFNRFPYDTFYWRGIDGTQMLTHFVTTPEAGSPYYTYNGSLSPSDVNGLWDNYRQKDLNDELLCVYGWGDGGGGPTKEMLEFARGLKNMPGIPAVRLETVEPFFERLERRLAGREVPVWDGELYMELHRGTYTSQAYNKRANRKAEILYHNAEWLSALADLLTGLDAYPDQALRSGWELILLNQFHDVLPGSSIHQVYEDSRLDYQKVTQIGDTAVDRALDALLDRLPAGQGDVVVFNPLSWERDGLIEMPWSPDLAERLRLPSTQGSGEYAPETAIRDRPLGQLVESQGEKKVLLEVQGIPPLGYRALPLAQLEDSLSPDDEIHVSQEGLENRYYRIRLDRQGHITSIWDKRFNRDVLAEGALGNLLQVFEDKPMNFDAWDVDIYYQEKMRIVEDLIEAVVEESGRLRGTLRLAWRFSDSLITQRIHLYRRSSRIDFETQVDWHAQQVLLKVAFPVAVRATRATYDIQFGNIERPTHWNTAWDWARFEVVGHKWVDLSEGDYGVALLNDCKYGHDVKDNVLRLTLIKSAIRPDPQADQGLHIFTYSLLPHAGDWRDGGVAAEAYDLNNPLLAVVRVEGGELKGLGSDGSEAPLPISCSFAVLDSDHVILETIKKDESGDAWIVRVYEYKQCRSAAVRLTFNRPILRAVECNLVEEGEQHVAHDGPCLSFPIQPYEIKTFKVWL